MAWYGKKVDKKRTEMHPNKLWFEYKVTFNKPFTQTANCEDDDHNSLGAQQSTPARGFVPLFMFGGKFCVLGSLYHFPAWPLFFLVSNKITGGGFFGGGCVGLELIIQPLMDS